MTIELAFSAANLLALVGILIKHENRMTKMETIVQLLATDKHLG